MNGTRLVPLAMKETFVQQPGAFTESILDGPYFFYKPNTITATIVVVVVVVIE